MAQRRSRRGLHCNVAKPPFVIIVLRLFCVQGRRHAAVLVLRELAITMPTYFYQQVSQFFELIFNAVQDSKPIIREGAADALRAALVVTAQRESARQNQKPQW